MASRKKQGASKKDAAGIWGYRGGGDKPRKANVVRYDKDGNVIGDDGYEMTPVRKRMHRIFDGWLVWVAVMAVAGFACMLLGYLQGAEYHDWEAVATGGNQYNGWDVAFLLRLEALLCLFTAVMSALISILGFKWFYDRGSAPIAYGLLAALAAPSIGYCAYAGLVVGAFEPVGLLNLAFIVLTLATMAAVKEERPTLRKPKVVREEVK